MGSYISFLMRHPNPKYSSKHTHNLSNQLQLAPISLLNSACSSLEKIAGRKAWKGTTVDLSLKPSVVSDVAQVSMVPTENYIRPRKKLSPTKTNALTRFVDKGLAMTERDMDARLPCSKGGICSEGMQKQYADYRASLNTHFGKSGINVSLILTYNPALDKYCECKDHTITGSTLRSKGIAIGTKLSKDGSTCVSRYYTKTPLESLNSRPDAITIPSLSSAQVGGYNRLLEQVNNEVQSIVTKHHEGDQESLMDLKKRASEIQQTMSAKFPGLEYFFSRPTHESWLYSPFKVKLGTAPRANAGAQVVKTLDERLDSGGQSVRS